MSQSTNLFNSQPQVSPTSTVPAINAPILPPQTISVVIPAYNDLKHLILCLKSLVATGQAMGQAGKLQILVQDDASPDLNLAEIIGPPATVERNATNLGFAGNCNAGAIRASGDVILFLNQDTVAHPDWFGPLLAAFHNDRVGVVGCKLISPRTPTDKGDVGIQSCGGLYDAGRGPFHRFLGWAPDDWRVNVFEPVSWVTGAALAIRRELFFRVGGFDVGYQRGYFEDVDLCEKVKAAGYEVWYCPGAVFEHKVGASGGVPPEIFRANSIRFHGKWDAKIIPDVQVIHVNY